jgi:hypothetical protein
LSCDTGAAEGGAAGEFLSFECSEAVADGGESEDNCGGQEGGDVDDAGEVLDDRHDEVDARSRQVLVEHAHEVCESVCERTDPQQERDLNEDNQQAAHTKLLVCVPTTAERDQTNTYRQMTEKIITRLKWKMLAIPRAIHRKMHNTPILQLVSTPAHLPQPINPPLAVNAEIPRLQLVHEPHRVLYFIYRWSCPPPTTYHHQLKSPSPVTRPSHPTRHTCQPLHRQINDCRFALITLDRCFPGGMPPDPLGRLRRDLGQQPSS